MITAPFSYNADRSRSGSAIPMSAAQSIMKSGKLWLNEDDTYTHLATANNDNDCSKDAEGGAQNEEETLDLLRRNLAMTLAGNYAIWWMDLNGAGWFDDPEMWKTMKELIPFEKALQENPLPHRPELALAFDQKGAMYFMGEHSKEGAPPNFAGDHVFSLSTSGAPLGVYLQDDIFNGRSKAKLTVFLSCYAMDAAQRKQMRDYAAKNGCIWLWAPGYIDIDKNEFSTKTIEEVTGFKVREVKPDTWCVWALPWPW
jgi:hypothetical protein